MHRPTRILTALVACAAPLLIGAAKPKPAPAPFVPALAYKYGPEEIRLSNMGGSQAVLLVRKPRGDGILWLSLAPLSQGRVAYIEATNSGTVRSLRIVSFAPQSTGGLAVTIDAQPMLTGPSNVVTLAGIDFSPDGTQLAVLSSDYGTHSELRIFDVASRQQVGETISLAEIATSLTWRGWDNAILLRSAAAMSAYKDGVETKLFDGNNQTSEPEAFNGTSPDVLLPFKDYPTQGNFLFRWDGVTINGGMPALTAMPTGLYASMSCDNARMIYSELGPTRTVYNLNLATGAKVFFSKDSSIQRMSYPKSCG